MEELSAAVLICLNPQVDKNVADQALAYCQNIRQSQDGWAFVLQHLSTAMRPEVAFWCCQVLQEILVNPSRYPVQFSPEQRSALRAKILTYLKEVIGPLKPNNASLTAMVPHPRFLLNKLSQLIAALIARDYPSEWGDAFRGTIMPLASTEEIVTTESVGMFLRLLRAS